MISPNVLIPVLNKKESYDVLIKLLNQGITRRNDLKANGVRVITLRNYYRKELNNKKIRDMDELLKYNELLDCKTSVLNYYKIPH